MEAGKVLAGVVGDDCSLEQAYHAARCCALQQLATIRQALGTLDAVRRIISLNGYVNCVPGFQQTPQVINGASDLLGTLYGEKCKHVRASIGVCGLPKGAAVEIQMVVSI